MKDGNKDTKLTLRITSDMLSDLQLLADKDMRMLSDYIRIKLKEIIVKSKAVNLSISESKFAEREEKIKAIAAKIKNKL